ncbi:MAG: EF-hand domain-containing protein [Candidatus Competibacteraceae bacterium]|nr:EF-hand domain-containing protein [Candidatus Competibacteraceae bacterium]MBK8963592.1 EF-hand domain-containing protein [Candidatus Competibacteraceae bacterium]MBK9950483.1 EF-hand domain-containing protein [Candidatus Competibacteraceae bacterium]
MASNIHKIIKDTTTGGRSYRRARLRRGQTTVQTWRWVMMNFKINVMGLGIVFAAVLAAPVIASAQGMGRGMGKNMPAFAEYDLNGDGKIVMQEFNEARAKRIGDKARQGYPMRNAGNAPAFEQIDRNGDGSISAEEFSAHQSERRPGR